MWYEIQKSLDLTNFGQNPVMSRTNFTPNSNGLNFQCGSNFIKRALGTLFVKFSTAKLAGNLPTTRITFANKKKSDGRIIWLSHTYIY